MQKRVRLRSLHVIIFKPPARPSRSKLISKVGAARIEYSNFVQEVDVRGQKAIARGATGKDNHGKSPDYNGKQITRVCRQGEESTRLF